ncbi:LysR family transcriptional regulator [Herbaspirillum seropedicae]|uniref:LysR family transcription regulator protein n=2 Tax=Herbaspirillum seropedicae TaxID=964 RepID=D8J246_HERSS|nr:LysR family transcriptional regulator [Herbaspirillum seropedicae]ADJ64829.1 LysR family transcription regulator protein [Herbaspirillum seropedicae SmR1]AKN66734.1 LysR family transcriptional regulator [Herbaspirillum seropedicae]AON55609.1 LysR family transcription regulator protein [Herbaspirillum seropedicae]MDR6397459.1 LysR family transcriptional regulator of beta-lactamase [Herbaspirillum seropedicae]NQE28269.1 LysR family transcriptional regulator [Herbaspirillum seropedicae]
MYLPLNALRAFEVSARHLSFTRAAEELSVTQTAVSMQVKNLEQRLGVALFRRLPRGLALTDEGLALLPVVAQSFGRIADVLAQFEDGRRREVLTVGVVGTFAVGWLMPRLRQFQQQHPFVDLRLLTNNNRVDLAGEGLDYAIRFGDGAWHGTQAERLFEAPLAPMCAPAIAARLRSPADLGAETLLRSYRSDEWGRWFAAAGAACPPLRGFVFDSSLALAEAAAQEAGVALLPVLMFERELQQGRLVCPFGQRIVLGAYWLTSLKSRPQTAAMAAFRQWLQSHAGAM